MSVYKRLRAANANVIFGYGSAEMEVISPSLSRNKIPGVCFYGFASPAGYRTEPRYYAATSGTAVEQFARHVKWFLSNWKENRPARIGLLIADVPSWRILGDPEGAKAVVERMGAQWTGAEWMPTVTTDTSVQIARMMKKGVDLISEMGNLALTIVMARDLSRLGVDLKKVTVVSHPAGWDERLAKIIPREGEGLYGEINTATADEDLPGIKLAKEVAQWRGRTPEEVNNTYLPGFLAGYILKAGVKGALEKAGADKTTPTDIRDALFSLKNLDVGGLMPEITVDEPDYPIFFHYVRYQKIEGGQFKVVSDWVKNERVQYGRK